MLEQKYEKKMILVKAEMLTRLSKKTRRNNSNSDSDSGSGSDSDTDADADADELNDIIAENDRMHEKAVLVVSWMTRCSVLVCTYTRTRMHGVIHPCVECTDENSPMCLYSRVCIARP